MNDKILTFEDAIQDSNGCKRHLLLGNGFSISCFPDIFTYQSIYDEADFSSNPDLEKVFKVLQTQDFETVIKSLEAAAKIIGIYLPRTKTPNLKNDTDALKDLLTETIAKNHPDNPSCVSHEQFQHCRKFLSHFLGSPNNGQVYTLNYDLLLYWTLMHDPPEGFESVGDGRQSVQNLKNSDGFGNDEDNPDSDYVVWQGEGAPHSAKVHFLHGALHLFDAGSVIQKYTWIRTGETLVNQAREAMEADKFPIFVSEATSDQKKSKIRHNAYLYQGLKQLASNAKQRNSCFFIHGHSLADNDDHILNEIGRRCGKIYVSLYGDPDSDANKKIKHKATNLAELRSPPPPSDVKFYDAESANVWGTQS